MSSLLKRLERHQEQPTSDGEVSPMLQLTSAWSAWPEIRQIPALKILAENVQLSAEPLYVPGTWASISTGAVIYANPLRLAPAEEWKFVLAHLLAHLGLRHSPTDNAARFAVYEITANALVVQLGIGTPPEGFLLPVDDWRTDADAVYEAWQRAELLPAPGWMSAAGPNGQDIIDGGNDAPSPDVWAMMLTRGLLENIGGSGGLVPWATIETSKARQALHWFTENFPLLASLAAHFNIVDDRDTIAAFQIAVAAVVPERMEILFNPDVDLTPAEVRFIIAHEMLHVGLLHQKRREERDPFLWNVACDYVINAWLIDMGVGDIPPHGGLYDPRYAGLSANVIYDRLLEDPDWARTLVTFRGAGLGDMLPPGALGKNRLRLVGGRVVSDLAEELLKQGIDAHLAGNHGLLPAGLLEMVKPAPAPPPPWKLTLTRWFAGHFEPVAPARSYARQSRRQQSTPDIPRPRCAVPQYPDGSGLFGVLLDTSGSMDDQLLGRCLGAIAALAQAHSIREVRLVFCDGTPYDQGFVPTSRLTEPMSIKGRGGTQLQPGIKLFEEAKDFPKDAPIMIITDGECDVLDIEREHAFLIPEGKKLPFAPVGPVFGLK
jgi:predicted metal-dependent peptidase